MIEETSHRSKGVKSKRAKYEVDREERKGERGYKKISKYDLERIRREEEEDE